MHAVDVGVGGYDHVVVAQAVDTVLYVEGGLEQVEFLVFVHHLACEAERVERFAAQREHGLGVNIAYLRNRAGGGVALGDEYRRCEFLFLQFGGALLALEIVGVVEVYAAVAQLRVVEVHFFCSFAGKFGHSGHSFALAFALLYLFLENLGSVEIFVQIVVELFLEEVADEFGHCHAAGTHLARAQLGFCLRFKHRLLNLHRHCGNHAVAYVGVFKVAAEKFFDSARHRLLEGCKVRAPLGGVLPVDEGVVLLAVLVGVGECYLYVVSPQVYHRIEGVLGHVGFQKVEQAVARHEFLAVEIYRQPGVEIGVVAYQRHDIFLVEAESAEHRGVGGEFHICAVGLVGVGFGSLLHQGAAGEGGRAHASVAAGAYHERGRQGIYGLDAHAV